MQCCSCRFRSYCGVYVPIRYVLTSDLTIRELDAECQRSDAVDLFRRRLESVIGRSGLTTSGFARLAGVDRSTLSQLLDDADPRLPRADTLMAIAKAAHVSTDWLLGLSQREEVGAEIIEAMLQIEVHDRGPADDQFVAWLNEVRGLPDQDGPGRAAGLREDRGGAALRICGSLDRRRSPLQLEAVRARLDYHVQARQ